jgi:hypothetical protein
MVTVIRSLMADISLPCALTFAVLTFSFAGAPARPATPPISHDRYKFNNGLNWMAKPLCETAASTGAVLP